MPKIDLNVNNFSLTLKERKVVLPDITGILSGLWTWLTTPSMTLFGVTFSGFQLISFIVTIGLTIYSVVSSGSGKRNLDAPNALDANGQLVNTRQASDPLRVAYGICKTGGVWFYSKATRTTNDMLNIVVSWSEGEIEGIANAIDSSPIYSGSTLNDLETGGELISAGCSCDNTCYTYTACSCYVYV